MEQTQDKPTLSRKRIPESHVEGGSEKERKKLKKARIQLSVGLVEIQDIVDTIADKDGTVLKSFLKGN